MSTVSACALTGPLRPEELVECYAPLVKKIAHHLLGRLPDGMELEDLIQTGLIALIEAMRQFSPTKGASFETYANIRVRGAMLDEFRNSDWAPRSVYRKQRQLTAAVRIVENRTGAQASPREIADELGVTLDEYFRMVAVTATQRMFSLEQAGENLSAAECEELEPRADPATEIESKEFDQAVADAIRGLPDREARVMSLYYDKELNLKQIGAVLSVSESRVCQIHGQALTRLRSCLQDWVATRHGSASQLLEPAS